MTFLKAHGRFILSACLALALGGLLVSDALWQHVLGPVPISFDTACVCPKHMLLMAHAEHPHTLFCEDETTGQILMYWHIGAATCVDLGALTDINDLRDELFHRAATLPTATVVTDDPSDCSSNLGATSSAASGSVTCTQASSDPAAETVFFEPPTQAYTSDVITPDTTVSRTWVLPDLSGQYYGSPVPLQPGDCLRVTAARNLEKVDVCQKEEK
jgi:hypothetical protein